jgi:beta-barrel assembly-enhancing protease
LKRPQTMAQELLLMALLVVASLAASYGVATLVRKPLHRAGKGIDNVPVSWEVRLKDGIKRYIEHDSRVINDKRVTAAIDTIRSRLLAHETDTTYHIEIIVVESDEVNAATLPGGLIVVFTPLIRLTSSPEELAAVLAHEIGHVVHRDPLKQMAKEFGVSAVLSMVNGGKAPPMVETMVKRFLDIQYTREQESAADDYALRLLSAAHINPVCFADVMEKLSPDTLSEKTSAIGYLATHPAMPERIANARNAAKEFKAATAVELAIDWDEVKRALPSLFGK